MLMRRVVVLVATILLSFISISFVAPMVHAGIECTVQINDQNYPLKLYPGQEFDIVTFLTVTCNQASVPVSGRVDVYDNSTGKLLNFAGFPVGANPTSPQWSINAAVTNKLYAPLQPRILYLRMVIWLAIGEGVPALTAGRLERNLQVEVGEAAALGYTTPVVIGQGTNSTSSVYISSNSTITAATYDTGSRLITFKASGPNATTGFTAVLLPAYLIDGSPVVVIDGGNVQPISLFVSGNSTHYLVSFGYPLSEHSIILGGSATIPEFTQAPIPLMLSVISVAVVMVSLRLAKRKAFP